MYGECLQYGTRNFLSRILWTLFHRKSGWIHAGIYLPVESEEEE